MKLTPEHVEKLLRYNQTAPLKERWIMTGTHGGEPVGIHAGSLLVGGQSGMGKSHIMANLSCGAVLACGRLVVFDPHCNEEENGLLTKIEPLRPWFLREPMDFDEPEPVLEQFRWMHQEYITRRSTKGMHGFWQPVYGIIDEFNELLTMFEKNEVKEIAKMLGNLARGGRKYGMYVIICAHNWNLQNTGGSDVRTNISGARIAVGCEAGAAATMLAVTQQEVTPFCHPPLRKGDAIIKPQEHGLQRVHFPKNDPEDSQVIADLVEDIIGFPDGYAREQSMPSNISQFPVLLPIRNERVSPVSGNGSPPASPDKHAQEANVESEERGFTADTENMPVLAEQETEKQGKRETVIYWRIEGMSHRRIAKLVKLSGKKYQPMYVPLCRELGLSLHPDDPMTPQEWEYMKRHYDYSCLACGRREPEIELEPDHIVPGSKGGSDALRNRQPLCKPCNCSKKDRTIDYRKGQADEPATLIESSEDEEERRG